MRRETMSRKQTVGDIAVIGLGRFGSSLALRLTALGRHVLGCDRDPEIVKSLANEIAEAVILDAQDENALQMVGITSFNTVIVALSHDFEYNALVTASLKKLGIPHVITVADSQRHLEILIAVGADRVVLPQEEAANQLAEELSAPGVLEVLFLDPVYRLIELKTPAGLVGKTFKTSSQFEVSLLLIIREGNLIVSPEDSIVLNKDDILVVVGQQKNLVNFSLI
jgi:trk system potassium uptake protein TrkA